MNTYSKATFGKHVAVIVHWETSDNELAGSEIHGIYANDAEANSVIETLQAHRYGNHICWADCPADHSKDGDA